MKRFVMLIDGAFFVKQVKEIRRDRQWHNAAAIVATILEFAEAHLARLNAMHKVQFVPADPLANSNWMFFYDALPYDGKGVMPITGMGFNYAESRRASFQWNLLRRLKKLSGLELRLGHCRIGDPEWDIKQEYKADFHKGILSQTDLTDMHFEPTLQQKGVDMQLGVDFATMAIKQQVDTFVLVTGDADFIPAINLARGEGCQVILDPLEFRISKNLRKAIGNKNIVNAFPRTRP